MRISILAACLLASTGAQALTTTFVDRATFISTISNPIEHVGFGDFTIAAAPGSSTAYVNFVSSSIMPEPELAFSGEENFTASFSGTVFVQPVFAFGFDFYEPTSTATIDGCNVPTCVDSTFKIDLLSGGSVVGTQNYNAPDNQLAFLGILSDTSFDAVRFTEISGSNDNEFWSRFVTGGPAPVPLPAALPLFLVGLGALGWVGHRRKA